MDMWNSTFDIQVNGKRGPGRPKMTWKQLTERDHREWKLSAIDPHDRDIWCEICHACSKPVAWKGAHCCGYGPCTCTLIKNPMMMMITVILLGVPIFRIFRVTCITVIVGFILDSKI